VQTDGNWCLVMELVDGLPFTDFFQNIAELPNRVEKLRPILRQLVDAVGFLHDTGLLHCDVKPTNVLVTPTGRVVVLDFGLVTEWRPESIDTSNRELVGSLGYIP